ERCRALGGAEPGPDPDGLEVVDPALGESAVGDVAIVVPCVEDVGIAGLREELLGTGWIVGSGGRLPEELAGARDDAAVDPGKAQRLRLIDGLAIDGLRGGQPYAPIVPRRLRIPLLREIEPEGALDHLRLEAETRRAL